MKAFIWPLLVFAAVFMLAFRSAGAFNYGGAAMFIERRRVPVRTFLYAGIICGLLVIIGYLLLDRHATAPTPNNAVAVPAVIAPELKHADTIAMPLKSGTVRAYAPAVKRSLKLPDALINDQAAQVIAASRIRADEHPQTVTTVINSDTGEAIQYVHEEPLPWFDLDTRGEAGLFVGMKNGEKAARMEVRQGVLAVKSAHLGLIASADQPIGIPLKADTFIGAGVWLRW